MINHATIAEVQLFVFVIILKVEFLDERKWLAVQMIF